MMKKMKKLYIISALFIGALAFTACEEQDKTPVFTEPTEFVLNEPVLKNNFIDLAKSESVELACSQPDYGFTAATKYQIQVSRDGKFLNEFDEKKVTGDYVTIDVDFSTARMDVPASEIAIALTQLRMVDLVAEDPDITEDEMKAKFPYETAAYIRVKASLAASGKGEIVSNVVSIANLRCPYSLPEVYTPEEFFIVGQYNNWDWGTAFEFIHYNENNTEGKGKTGTYWRLIYLPADGGFKVNAAKEWDGGEVGYVADDPLYKYNDNASAGLKASSDGNMVVTKGGWYLVIVRMVVEGRDIIYTFDINKPEVYLMGTNAPVNDWSINEANLFTVPAEADADFVSPAFAYDTDGDGGVRACVIVGQDASGNPDTGTWWKSEFMTFNGKIEYRATGGDQERVNGKKGQKLYLNFTKGTGSIK